MPGLSKFGDGVKIVPKPVKHPNMLFDFKPEASLRLLAVQQSEIYKYRFQTSDYTCDIAQVREFKVENPGVMLAPKFSTKRPVWTVSVSSDVWSKLFDRNAHVSMGEGADWKADAETFFPTELGNSEESGEPVDGFGEVLKRLNEVGCLFAKAAEQDSALG